MVDEELHVPPIEASLNTADWPSHKASGPDIGVGGASTEIVLTTVQPLPIE